MRLRLSAYSTAEIRTKTSALPSSGGMKPKPLVELSHYTVPMAMMNLPAAKPEG
jgi:hypothetical protein